MRKIGLLSAVLMLALVQLSAADNSFIGNNLDGVFYYDTAAKAKTSLGVLGSYDLYWEGNTVLFCSTVNGNFEIMACYNTETQGWIYRVGVDGFRADSGLFFDSSKLDLSKLFSKVDKRIYLNRSEPIVPLSRKAVSECKLTKAPVGYSPVESSASADGQDCSDGSCVAVSPVPVTPVAVQGSGTSSGNSNASGLKPVAVTPVTPSVTPAPAAPTAPAKTLRQGLGAKNIYSQNYTLLNGTTVTNQAQGRPKVLLFMQTICSRCMSTTKSVSKSYAKFADIDLYEVEINRADKTKTQAFRDKYGSSSMKFAYDTGSGANGSMWAYLALAGVRPTDGVGLPVLVYIDAQNKVQYIEHAHTLSAEHIREIVDDYLTFSTVAQVTSVASGTASAGTGTGSGADCDDGSCQVYQVRDVNVSGASSLSAENRRRKEIEVARKILAAVPKSEPAPVVAGNGMIANNAADGKFYYDADAKFPSKIPEKMGRYTVSQSGDSYVFMNENKEWVAHYNRTQQYWTYRRGVVGYQTGTAKSTWFDETQVDFGALFTSVDPRINLSRMSPGDKVEMVPLKKNTVVKIDPKKDDAEGKYLGFGDLQDYYVRRHFDFTNYPDSRMVWTGFDDLKQKAKDGKTALPAKTALGRDIIYVDNTAVPDTSLKTLEGYTLNWLNKGFVTFVKDGVTCLQYDVKLQGYNANMNHKLYKQVDVSKLFKSVDPRIDLWHDYTKTVGGLVKNADGTISEVYELSDAFIIASYDWKKDKEFVDFVNWLREKGYPEETVKWYVDRASSPYYRGSIANYPCLFSNYLPGYEWGLGMSSSSRFCDYSEGHVASPYASAGGMEKFFLAHRNFEFQGVAGEVGFLNELRKTVVPITLVDCKDSGNSPKSSNALPIAQVKADIEKFFLEKLGKAVSIKVVNATVSYNEIKNGDFKMPKNIDTEGTIPILRVYDGDLKYSGSYYFKPCVVFNGTSDYAKNDFINRLFPSGMFGDKVYSFDDDAPAHYTSDGVLDPLMLYALGY